MDTYRTSTWPSGVRRERRWAELDAELLIAFLSAVLVLAGVAGRCGQTGLTLGLLGLLASLSAIGAWLRRR